MRKKMTKGQVGLRGKRKKFNAARESESRQRWEKLLPPKSMRTALDGKKPTKAIRSNGGQNPPAGRIKRKRKKRSWAGGG